MYTCPVMVIQTCNCVCVLCIHCEHIHTQSCMFTIVWPLVNWASQWGQLAIHCTHTHNDACPLWFCGVLSGSLPLTVNT